MAKNSVRVNKWLDFLDRVGWTAVQTGAAATFVVLTSDGMTWEAGLKSVGIAVGIAVVKVITGQHVGGDETGAVLPTNAPVVGEK